MANTLINNAHDLELELEWFADVLNARLNYYFGKDGSNADVLLIQPPDLSQSNSYYGKFITDFQLTVPERLIILLALIPHIRPQLLDVLWVQNEATARGFTEFGGLKGVNHSGFIPTGETAAFIIAGDELAIRFEITRIFDGDHLFSKQSMLSLAPTSPGEPMLSGALVLSREYLNWFITGI